MDCPELLIEVLAKLGFSDTSHIERYGVDMFSKRPNTGGLDVLLHFLFQRYKGAKQAHKVSHPQAKINCYHSSNSVAEVDSAWEGSVGSSSVCCRSSSSCGLLNRPLGAISKM